MSTPNKPVAPTRGSALALVQAEMTEGLLRAAFPEAEIVRKVIPTTGDRRTDVSLAEVAKVEGVFDKGVFIKELETALENGEIDIAVHSLKDVPTVLEDQFEIVSVLERAPVADVLVTKLPGGLDGLPQGAKVASSSCRRCGSPGPRRWSPAGPDAVAYGGGGSSPPSAAGPSCGKNRRPRRRPPGGR